MKETSYVYIIIIIGMNVVDNLNSGNVINKPCVCSRTMHLSTFCGLHRDQEQLQLFVLNNTGSRDEVFLDLQRDVVAVFWAFRALCILPVWSLSPRSCCSVQCTVFTVQGREGLSVTCWESSLK
jgi:hypothetical protein